VEAADAEEPGPAARRASRGKPTAGGAGRPAAPPTALGALWWRRLGPGLLFAVASMGSSHFLLAPSAGAAYGYVLAWTILFAHAVKFPAFDHAARYTVASGSDLLEGFRTVPGPRGWAVAAFTIGVALQSVTIVAGVTAVCAAVLIAILPGLGLLTATTVVCGVAGILLWFGAYRTLERVSVVILLAVAALTVVAAVVARPDLAALAEGSVRPLLPSGAVLLAGGLLGYMPAPLELAVMESLWVHERHGGAPAPERPARMRIALADFRIGYAASVVLGLLLLSLGAALLAPRGLVPVGAGVFSTLAGIYRTSLGSWAVPVYLTGALLGMFATSYGVLDGFPRMMSRGLSALGFPVRATERGRDIRYWLILYAMVLVGLVAVLLVPDPARLVSLAATGTVLVGPLWYVLIILVTHRLPVQYRPTRAGRAAAWLGFAGMCATAGFVAWSLLAL
jgi:Mn2+/Fe2+ NRAMP family transporter